MDRYAPNSPVSIARAVVCLILLAPLACAPQSHEDAPATGLGAGSAECAPCHHDEVSLVRRSGHRGGPAGTLGCLGCHGPHDPGPEDRGPHESVPLEPAPHEHGPNEATDASGAHGDARLSSTELGASGLHADCEDCHASVVAEFRLPFRHPLGAGGITCTSCHPPHGMERHAEREELRHRTCVSCHPEKKGPFLFHHDGRRRDQCLSCHVPHGSANLRLLTHATDRMLCFSCHEFIEIFHIQAEGSFYRECLTFHTEIHGSNWERHLLR